MTTLQMMLAGVMGVCGLLLAYLNMRHTETPIWISVVFLVIALVLLPLVMPNP